MQKKLSISFTVYLLIFGCSKFTNPISTPSSMAVTTQDLVINGPFTHWIYNRKEDIFDTKKKEFQAEYKPVNVLYDGKVIEAKMRLRGGIRFCNSFPHFKLKLPKSGKILDQREFKIVTHGHFDTDSSIPIDAPACGNQLGTGDPSEVYKREFYLYKLQEDLLSKSLKAFPFNVNYRDDSSSLDIKKFAFMLEDTEHAAERMGLKEIEYSKIDDFLNWTEKDPDEIYNAALGDVMFDHLNEIYQSLEVSEPDLSPKELTAKLPSFEELIEGQVGTTLKEKARQLADHLQVSIEADQKKRLKALDPDSVLEAIWFNSLIGNTDWALFGINRHSAGTRNFKFFVNDDGTVFPVAYDFDLAKLADGTDIVSVDDYRFLLESVYTNLSELFDGYLLDKASEKRQDFADRVDKLVAQGLLESHVAKSLENFSSVLRNTDPNFFKNSQN